MDFAYNGIHNSCLSENKNQPCEPIQGTMLKTGPDVSQDAWWVRVRALSKPRGVDEDVNLSDTSGEVTKNFQ